MYIMNAMSKFNTFEELRDFVNQPEHKGVVTVTMEELRDTYGVDKLGVHVRDGIVNKLDGVGLKPFPRELPKYQHEEVRIYRSGSPIAEVIDAVLNPSPDHDQELRDLVGGGHKETIQKIKELVCD